MDDNTNDTPNDTTTDAPDTPEFDFDDDREDDRPLPDRLIDFIDAYCAESFSDLVSGYPNDTAALEVSWRDLNRWDPDAAADVIDSPGEMERQFQEAISLHDHSQPAHSGIVDAAVEFYDLPETDTFYPGSFSPSGNVGKYRSIKGEIIQGTDVRTELVTAVYRCERCTVINETAGTEPHECKGCERQGPFTFLKNESTFRDKQLLLVQEPPDVSAGDGRTIETRIYDHLTDATQVGDSVTISGTIGLEPMDKKNLGDTDFTPYILGRHVQRDQTDADDLDITNEMRERVQNIVNWEKGDPLKVAGDGLAPEVRGYDHIKQVLVLAMVGGARKTYDSGGSERGQFHVLLVGDPSTGKSELATRVEEAGWRTVGVSGKGASIAGVTAAAVQDDFGGTTQPTLKAGAFVKANNGTVVFDEMDDAKPDVLAALNEPLAQQTIHVNKWGINARLHTRAGLVGTANPKEGRFDEYQSIVSQLGFDAALLSRFDLVYVFHDRPNAEDDGALADHVLRAQDTAKRQERGLDVPDEDLEAVTSPIDGETLRAWIAMAKRQPAPVFESDEIREMFREKYVELRGLYDYDDDEPIPVTLRKVPGAVRVAESAAKLEFSDVITERHATIALNAIQKSMRDFGVDEDGKFDADTQETTKPKSQRDRVKVITQTLAELQSQEDYNRSGVPHDVLFEESGVEKSKFDHEVQKLKNKGDIYEPNSNECYRLV